MHACDLVKPHAAVQVQQDGFPLMARMGFELERRPIRIDGRQVCRSVFPLWQRLFKAPFVIALAWWHGRRPNKFVLVGRKRGEEAG